MKKCVVIINGPAEHGKDTFIKFCEEKANIMNISSVDKVKEVAQILGCVEKKEKDRKFLSELKTLADDYYDHSFKYLKSIYDFFMDSSKCECEILFIHIREVNNIERVKKAFGAITVFVLDPNKDLIISNNSDRETVGSTYEYDYNVFNKGSLEDLKRLGHNFVEYVRTFN